MQADKYIQALLTMMDDTFMYRARTVKLKDVIIDGEDVTIELYEGHPIRTTVSGLKETLSEFLPTAYTKKSNREVAKITRSREKESEESKRMLESEEDNREDAESAKEELVPAKKEDSQLKVMGTGKNLTVLEEILMDNITKLKEDRSYLDQAKEINNHANSIIKIAKTKVDMVREIRKQTQG